MTHALSESSGWSDRVAIAVHAATNPAHMDAARTLFKEYAASLNRDACFQDFGQELAALPRVYAGPRGCILLATVAGEYAGCCGLRPLDACDYANACEMKRLYVRPRYRGLGLGRRLAEAALEHALQADFSCVLLDTLDDMEAARTLYEELGFKDIPPYYYNPIAGAHYLKVDL